MWYGFKGAYGTCDLDWWRNHFNPTCRLGFESRGRRVFRWVLVLPIRLRTKHHSRDTNCSDTNCSSHYTFILPNRAIIYSFHSLVHSSHTRHTIMVSRHTRHTIMVSHLAIILPNLTSAFCLLIATVGGLRKQIKYDSRA